MNCSRPGFPVYQQLREFTQTLVHQIGITSSIFFSVAPFFLLPSNFPSIRVFSNELVLCIMWPKHWSFSFSISPSNSGLISFRTDWFDLLAVQSADISTFINVKKQHQSQKSKKLTRSLKIILMFTTLPVDLGNLRKKTESIPRQRGCY